MQRTNISSVRQISNAQVNSAQSERSHAKNCPAYQDPKHGNRREKKPHFKDINYIPEAARNASLVAKCNCKLPAVKTQDKQKGNAHFKLFYYKSRQLAY